MSNNLLIRKKTGLVLSVAVIVLLSCAFRPPAGLTDGGMTTIGLMLAFLIILITEALPVVLTCFLLLGLMPVLQITPDFSSALTGFSNQVVFFILASFGIAEAVRAVPLSRRILKFLLRFCKKDMKQLLLAMMLSAALISSVVSNVPTCAVFMAVSLNLLNIYETEADRRKTGRAFMIGVPVASMIGGMMTPAGSSINLLAIGLLEDLTGQTVSFVQWMSVGIPLTLVALPVAWFFISTIHKMAPIQEHQLTEFLDSLDVPEKMDINEKKVTGIIIIMFILWILSSWIDQINVMVVALLGCCMMFLPGIEVLEMKDFMKNVSWDSFFLVGTVLSMGNAVVKNGISDWITSVLPEWELSASVCVLFTAILMFLLLIIVPVAPSLVTIMAVPLVSFAEFSHLPPSVTILACAFCASNCYLLPLDTVTLLTYSQGYYSMSDLAKSSALLQVFLAVMMSIWIPAAGYLTGMM